MVAALKKYTLAVIIPMYNEAAGAERCVTEVMKVISPFSQIKLIIVNDGSTDGTEKILQTQTKKFGKKVLAVHHLRNKGYGAALQTGIRVAKKMKFDYLLFMDSDLTNHPKYIVHFFKKMTQNYDCVKASRFIPKGKMVGVPKYRQLLSQTANQFARMCFRLPIHDCTNGFRMVKRTAIEKIPYTKNDFSLILEELYYLKKNHATVTEIPSVLTNRTTSLSHFSYSLPLLLGYLRYTLLACQL